MDQTEATPEGEPELQSHSDQSGVLLLRLAGKLNFCSFATR
jgi:hypothetical protein